MDRPKWLMFWFAQIGKCLLNDLGFFMHDCYYYLNILHIDPILNNEGCYNIQIMSSKSPKKAEKSEKSKSKQKIDKPPKDNKSKKSKETEPKKKSQKKSKEVADKSKSDINESQSNLSFFNPPFFSPQQVDDAICQLHKQKNTIFCEICDLPGCSSCTVFGPHNNQMHRINKIDQSYKARYLYLNQLVCGGLIQKRQKLNAQIQKLNQTSQQLKYHKYGIEKLTKIQFTQTLERLKNSAGSKFAILHHEMAQLQKDLQAINNLGNQFFQLTNMNPETFTAENNPKGMIPFLLRTRYLQEEAQNLISKPIKVSIDVYPYDLPREITERKIIMQKSISNNEIVNFKNQAIWRLVEEKKTQVAILMQQFEAQANEQCEQWAKLNTKLKLKIQNYNLCCHFCGITLSAKSVNEQCNQNQSGSGSNIGYSLEVIPADNLNNGYHYFAVRK